MLLWYAMAYVCYKSQLCNAQPIPAKIKAKAVIPHKGGIKRSRAWASEPQHMMGRAKALRIFQERNKRAGITLEAAKQKVLKGPLPFTPGPIIANKADVLGFTCFAPA